jgi:hypothetical protein
MRKLLIVCIIIGTLSSCKIVHNLIELHKTNVKVYTYKLDNKEIKYIPMHHMGKKEFYDHVKNEVTTYKNNGYKVYYEQISSIFTADSLLRDTIRRKARKLMGFSGTYKDNADSSLFKKFIQQPSYKDLGIDDHDVWADVNYLQLITQWEKINGQIILDSVDLNTPFKEKFSKGTFYTNKEYNKIIIKYRNGFLINLIKSNPDNKILVIYGGGHRKDFRKQLKKMNNNVP